jgi:hypothetical protein
MPKISRTISGARPNEGSSSSSRRGRSISARDDRQHLLLAARQRARLLVPALLQAREVRRTSARSRASMLGLALLRAIGAEAQVFLDGQRR